MIIDNINKLLESLSIDNTINKSISDSSKVVVPNKEIDKEIVILLNLTKKYIEEEKTKNYGILTPIQRNVIGNLCNWKISRNVIFQNYNKTLSEGFFNASFNTDETADEFIHDLENVLGVKNKFYYKQIEISHNKRIPGFNFAGYPVKGKIYETRLFRKD